MHNEQHATPEFTQQVKKSIFTNRLLIILLGMQALVFSLEITIYQSYIVLYLDGDLLIPIIIITFIISLQNFLQIFLRIPLADLSQIFGRKTLIIIGNVTLSLSLVCLFMANSFLLPVIGGILFAIGMSSFWPAIFAYLADIQTTHYAKNAGNVFLLGDFGIVVASFMAKYLLDGFLIALKFVFFIAALLGVILGIFLAILMPESLQKRKKGHSNIRIIINSFVFMFHSFFRVSSLPGWKKVVIYQIIIAYLDYTFFVFFPVLIYAHGYSLGTVGEIFFWGTLIPLVTYPYLGRLIDRFGYHIPVTIGIIIASLISIITAYIYNYLLFILIYIFMVICVVTGYTGLNSVAAKPSDESLRGVSLGVLGVYISIGRVLSIIFSGLLWDIYNINMIFIVSAILIIIFVVFLHLVPLENKQLTVLSKP